MRKQQEQDKQHSSATTAPTVSEKEKEWREGFEAMAKDPESMDAEYAREAQAEVVLDNFR